MNQAARNGRGEEAWAGFIVTAWAVVMLAGDLRDAIPYIHWGVSALAFVLLLPYLLRLRWKGGLPAQTPAWLLVVAVCIPVLYGAKALLSFAEAGKLIVILVGGIALFVTSRPLTRAAFRGFLVAVYLNLVLLAGGFLGLKTASIMAGGGRWGTLLDWPGSLWRVGISVWMYALYLLIKRRSLSALALWSASSLLVYADGARTAVLILILGAALVVLVPSFEARRFKRALVLSAAGLGLIAAFVAYSATASERVVNAGEGVERVTELSGSVQSQGIEGLEDADALRFQMLLDVSDAIQAHPFWGTGVLTTMSQTRFGPMVIHMTYLQVWADLGLLGLVSFLWLMWGWVAWVPCVLRRVRVLADPEQKALYYNALFLLLVYGINGLFHPLSTEWTEWILFVIPYAMIWEMVRASGAANSKAGAKQNPVPAPR